MRRYASRLLVVLVLISAAVYLFNASWRVPAGATEIRLIAHRGVHQTFAREGLQNDTCTAERIDPPTHSYLENTLPSMRAAFAAGADVVELDVHPTTDGKFAVLHDWTIDCRTQAQGVTRQHTMAYLKSLDVGYGYTADGGRSFPLRGRGVGLMPELSEVFRAMPEGRFLINFKSREAREGDMLAALMNERPEWRAALWGVYGGDEPTRRAEELLGTGLRTWSRQSMMACLGRYLAMGWAGVMPEACKGTTIMIPSNVAPWLWGWPHLLLKRMHDAGSVVILLGPYTSGDLGAAGIDTLEDLARVPAGFSGYL
jgi:glycerophosphoryl diester phosphodiesterase